MDPGNRTVGYSTQDTHNLHQNQPEGHHPDLTHRKGRDSAHSVEGHHPHATGHSPENESGLRKVINKLNPLHRSPSPTAKAHSPNTAASVGAPGGVTGHPHRSASSSPERQPGLSAKNPNVPGQDNRTFAEKTVDALHPGRHPDEHNPKQDNRTVGEKTRDTVDPRRHADPHHPRQDNRTLGEKARDHRRSPSSSPERQPGLSTKNPNVPGQDNRTLGEKTVDALHPARHPDQHNPKQDNRTLGQKTRDTVDPTRHSDPHHPGRDNRTLGEKARDHRRSPSSSPERQPGLSAVNPNVPGQDNRTLAEKAHDALHPGRHPDQHNPKQDNRTLGQKTRDTVDPTRHSDPHHPRQDNRTLGEKTRDVVDPRRHAEPHQYQHQKHDTIAHELGGDTRHHDSHGGRTHDARGAAQGMTAAAGLGSAGYQHHEHNKHDLLGQQRGTDHLGRTEHGPHMTSTHHDDRPTLEKVKDKIDPRVDSDRRREAQIVPGTGGHHVPGREVGDVEHSLRETRLDNDNPTHFRDEQSKPYAADSTDTFGRRQHQPDLGFGHGENKSSAGGGLHIRNADQGTGAGNLMGHNQGYRPDVQGENYQPGYSIPPTERKGEDYLRTGEGQGLQNREEYGLPGSGQRRETELPPVHATGFGAEGGDFDASRPGAAAEGRRLRDQADQTGTSLDASLR